MGKSGRGREGGIWGSKRGESLANTVSEGQDVARMEKYTASRIRQYIRTGENHHFFFILTSLPKPLTEILVE